MYEKNGISYAGELKSLARIIYVKPLENYELLFLFSTGEYKKYSFKGLLDTLIFKPLQDKEVFESVYINGGAPAWCDGTIDFDPDTLYEDGILVEEQPLIM